MIDALRAIRECDPDGDLVEPSSKDYEAHRTWAIETYGMEVWKVYISDNWSESSEL
jgi:hypothetical protein